MHIRGVDLRSEGIKWRRGLVGERHPVLDQHAQQFGKEQWLCDHIVDPVSSKVCNVGLERVPRESEHDMLALATPIHLPDLLHRLVPVHLRHLFVEQGQIPQRAVRHGVLVPRNGLDPVGRRLHRRPRTFQQLAPDFENQRDVVDEEDTQPRQWFRRRRRRGWSTRSAGSERKCERGPGTGRLRGGAFGCKRERKRYSCLFAQLGAPSGAFSGAIPGSDPQRTRLLGNLQLGARRWAFGGGSRGEGQHHLEHGPDVGRRFHGHPPPMQLHDILAYDQP
mmetsp:Transcript_53935/g.117322  ORF Transcript_53935/g.117322 Transcript_53935/m.117322 type:complete len:278 (-) Transcript_53935:164-997(-)